jgi:UDP-glucuronate 4-epimerase
MESTTPNIGLERDHRPRLLVTGCAGFIAARVASLLLDRGAEVVGIDNLNDAYDVTLKQWRLVQLERQPGFHFALMDIGNRAALRTLFERLSPLPGRPAFDGIVHLAARAGVRQSVADPHAYFETNVSGTLNLLELCRHFGVPKLVLASTSSLYGSQAEAPFREDARTDAPLSPYAASKKAAEVICHAFHHLHGLDVTVLRFFTVYGPAGRPDMSLFRFVQWIAEGRPVTIYGDGRQSRDFTFVDDVARGVCLALRPLDFEVINLGSDTPVVLADAIELIEKLVGRHPEVRYEAGHPADVSATWAHIGKARELLGWRPQVPFEEGVRRLVDWYRENRQWAQHVKTSEP